MLLSNVFQPQRDYLDKIFVVTPISNAARYKRRPELYKRFAEMIKAAGVKLITVELAFGQRDFEVTDPNNPFHLQLRSQDEFFHKENIINLGIAYGRRMFPQADKVCWVDADVHPARIPREWFVETWHELEHYKFVQMWEWLQPLDYYQNPLCSPNPSFMANYVKYGTPYPKNQKGYPANWGSPGGAWAANLSALDEIGGIPDVTILGAGDWYLAHVLISTLSIPNMQAYSSGYQDYWRHRQELCARYIKKDVGYVRGLLYHEWHGKTVNRGYNTRERILIEGQFDPRYDLKRDGQGVYQIEVDSERQIQMYDRIRAYFRARNEDEIS